MTSEQWTDRNTGKQRSKPVVKVERLALRLPHLQQACRAGATPPSVKKMCRSDEPPQAPLTSVRPASARTAGLLRTRRQQLMAQEQHLP
jgi:hypothetical protein